MKNNYMKENILLRETIIDLIVETHRFKRSFERMLQKMDAGEKVRYIGQLNWFNKKIDEALQNSGLRIINIEGQNYDIGMAATALNIGEFGENESLLIEQMLEPIIMHGNSIARIGTIILRRAE